MEQLHVQNRLEIDTHSRKNYDQLEIMTILEQLKFHDKTDLLHWRRWKGKKKIHMS